MRKNYTVRMREHWSRVPREAMEPPSLDILKTYLEGSLVQPVLGEPALAGNWATSSPILFCIEYTLRHQEI